MDKNRPHLGKLGMKLNSRALDTALPVGYLPMSRNALVEYSLEGLMLKCQFFGHVMQRTDSLEKTLMLGNMEGRRRMG